MRRMLLLLAILLGGYLLIVLAVAAMQTSMVFPGAGRGRGVALELGRSVAVEPFTLRDGKKIRLARAEPAGAPRAVLVWFLGNFEDLRSGVAWAEELARQGVLVLVPEYPGYGESEGAPSVESFLAAAEDVCAHAAGLARTHGVRLCAGGISLGSCSATHLAALGRVEALLLFAPLTSVVEIASRRFWWLPVRWLLRHRFDNLAKAPQVKCKVLVVHGDRDDIAPLSDGKRLAEALRGELIVANGRGHNDLFDVLREPAIAARIRALLVGE